LANGANSINVANTESILGGTGADTVVLTTVLNASGNAVDLGTSADTLTLANGANSLNVANTSRPGGGTARHRGVRRCSTRAATRSTWAPGADTADVGERRQQPSTSQHRGDPGGSGADTVVLTTAAERR